MITKKNLLLCLISTVTLGLFSQVRINEFMQSNIDCLMDDLNDFPDSWVELYNSGDTDIDIDGWYISLKKDYNKGWKLSGETLIPAKSYLIIHCDKAEKNLHTDFRLETTKKSDIYLFDASGQQVDLIKDIPAQPNPNISMGIDSDSKLSYFVKATPGGENSAPTAENITPSPVFDTKSGIYKSAISIAISNPSGIKDSKIYYTTDSSEPNANSTEYTEPFSINETTVVKAIIIADNYLIPRSVTASYIITNRDMTLPIISVSLDDTHLWDDMIGIYAIGKNGYPGEWPGTEIPANYRTDWRRPVNFEYFPDQNSTSVLNQLGETRIMGGYSREYLIKSMAIYSNKRFGTKHFSYPIFENEDKKDVIIKSFMLRNSGNDWPSTMIKDGLVHSWIGGKMNFDYQAYQPTIFYLNGEYKGIINIRERSNEDNIYGNYNELEDIDMFENWGELKAGDDIDFQYLKNKIVNPNTTYEELEQLIDIQSYIDLYILRIFLADSDFHVNNIVIWKKKEDGAKWRFILKDTDHSFYYEEGDPQYNLLKLFGTDEYHHIPVKFYNTLMSHNEFRKEFSQRFAIYMGDFMSGEQFDYVTDSIKQKVQHEMQYHIEKHADNIYVDFVSWGQAVENIKTWVSNRYKHQYQHLSDFFDFEGIATLKINKVDNEEPAMQMNGINLITNQFDGMYYKGQTINLKWVGDTDFNQWIVTTEYDNENPKEVKSYTNTDLDITITSNVKSIQIEAKHSGSSITPVSENNIKIISDFDKIRISGLEGNNTIEVYNLSGQKIKSVNTNTSDTSISLTNKGVYIVKISDGTSKISRKIIF